MARGKEAAKAANRRYETALEHIDRLTDELATAKVRYRDAERDAERLPVALAAVDRLSEQVAAGTSDEIQRLTRMLDSIRAEHQAEMELYRELVRELASGIEATKAKAVSERARDLAIELNFDFVSNGHSRAARRGIEKNGRNAISAGDYRVQDNRRTAVQNIAGKGVDVTR